MIFQTSDSFGVKLAPFHLILVVTGNPVVTIGPSLYLSETQLFVLVIVCPKNQFFFHHPRYRRNEESEDVGCNDSR